MHSLPPLPLSLAEAKAQSLKTFSAGLACRLDGTRERTVRGNHCVACRAREKAEREALERFIHERVRTEERAKARAAVLRELQAEQRRQQREAEEAAKAAEKATAKAQKEADREERKQKAAETRARNKAEKAASAALAVAQAVVPAGDAALPWEVSPTVPASSSSEASSPWTEFADCLTFDDDTAPW